jgi:hypothetical protein
MPSRHSINNTPLDNHGWSGAKNSLAIDDRRINSPLLAPDSLVMSKSSLIMHWLKPLLSRRREPLAFKISAITYPIDSEPVFWAPSKSRFKTVKEVSKRVGPDELYHGLPPFLYDQLQDLPYLKDYGRKQEVYKCHRCRVRAQNSQ